MFVKDYMLQHPIMIEPHKRLTEAQRMMAENGIYYLPVVGDGKRLVGMITPPRLSIAPEKLGSLDVWEITRYLNNLTIDKVMIKFPDLQTIQPDSTLEDAAEQMIRSNIGGLVVVEDKNVVLGLITDNDLLLELRKILGAIEPGWRVTVRMPGIHGEFLKLTRAISDNEWTLSAMGNVRSPKKEGHWDVVVKIWGGTRNEIIAMLDGLSEMELLDIRETRSLKS